MASSRTHESDIVLKGTTELIEPVGGECHFYVSIPGVSIAVTCVADMPTALQDGGDVTLYVPLEHVHLFDSETGLRVD